MRATISVVITRLGRVIQYAAACRALPSLECWIARSSRAMTSNWGHAFFTPTVPSLRESAPCFEEE
jgi:hypothetical protein